MVHASDGRRRWRTGVVLTLLILGTVGCRDEDTGLGGPLPDPNPPMGEAAPGAGVGLQDRAAAIRHADSLDSLAIRLQTLQRSMRTMPAPLAQPRFAEADTEVPELLDGIERGMADASAGMTDERLQQTLGLRPDQFSLLQEEIQAARQERRALQTATETEVRNRLPGHLDRIERIATTAESAAAQLRRSPESR